ncbi:hypothetical protein [Edaphobacter sp. DSM 109919]|uniref:Uncharacterized protein n=1 Tax=Edaphobacter paludis TaxID=3035702 RepID=A0AAU7D0R6_9BACT
MKNLSSAVCVLIFFALGCNSSQVPNHSSNIRQQSSRQQARTTQAGATSQPFDYYLLNLSWSPEFCHSHTTAAECAQHRAFTLHGLWPQNNTGPYQILDLFAKTNPSFPPESLALSCGNNYLTAIEVCMSKTLQPIACGAIRTCRANTVRIPPPR